MIRGVRLVRIGRNGHTDEPEIAGVDWIHLDERGEPCSFCNNEAEYSVAGGEVLYCLPCRIAEGRENHAFWIDLSVVTNVTISEDDGGIRAEIQGWRKRDE